MRHFILLSLVMGVVIGVAVAPVLAEVIAFENFAPAGGLVNVNPTMPYSEAGFTLAPTNTASAVFDSEALSDMPGNLTDWFGFAETNSITLTRNAGPPFSLGSVLMGRSTIATGPSINMTFVGNVMGGGTLTQTFTNLTTATTGILNWNNLNSVVITATDDAAIDDIAVSTGPLPGDMNCDGAVDMLDVQLFTIALVDPAGFTGCDITRADMNSDMFQNGKDIGLFVSTVVGP